MDSKVVFKEFTKIQNKQAGVVDPFLAERGKDVERNSNHIINKDALSMIWNKAGGKPQGEITASVGLAPQHSSSSLQPSRDLGGPLIPPSTESSKMPRSSLKDPLVGMIPPSSDSNKMPKSTSKEAEPLGAIPPSSNSSNAPLIPESEQSD